MTALRGVTALPAHAHLEAYSVLTRLPAGLAVAPEVAAQTLGERFADAPLALGQRERRRLLRTLAQARIGGGATYDALVALEAHAHGHELLTLDRRAQETYGRLGVPFRTIS